jgi:hypothetical protein
MPILNTAEMAILFGVHSFWNYPSSGILSVHDVSENGEIKPIRKN